MALCSNYTTTTVVLSIHHKQSHNNNNNKGDPSLKEFFRVSLGLTPHYKQDKPQAIKVIGAGLPRTGTASFVVALNKLGLHTYHMKDGAVETPGHLALWYGLYSNDKSVSFDDILQDVAEYGFNATADGPMCFWYKEQMIRYPNAKVVLTVRADGSGEAWAKSFTSCILDLLAILNDVPFRWFDMFPKVNVVASKFLTGLGTDEDPKTHYPVVEQLPEAYNRWVETVKKTVPEDKLLVHSPADGWKPLCDFISPLSAEIASNCDSILASGEPYPHVNDKAKVRGLLAALKFMSVLTKLSPAVLAVVIVSTFSRPRRRKRQIAVDDDDKSKSD